VAERLSIRPESGPAAEIRMVRGQAAHPHIINQVGAGLRLANRESRIDLPGVAHRRCFIGQPERIRPASLNPGRELGRLVLREDFPHPGVH
ncbi:hypothetical protein, partial [Actinotignum urinale]